jgi:DNA primase catalytic core
MIGKETIESIKQGVDLVALIQSRGISLKKNGKGYVGLCPFHKDKKPSLSVNLTTNLWQCFGCGAGGDVIRFVELFDKVPFPQAVKSLEAASPKLRADHEVKPAHPESLLTTKELKLLERVVSYYQHTLTQDQRGLNYLKNERGITDLQSLRDFGAGYVNGTLLEILPQDEEVINALKKIGLLNAKGHELFYNSVVFPLYNQNGSVVSLYGRSIDDGPSTGSGQAHQIHHLYLPGPRQGIINRQAVKRSQTILLTESVIDALTLYAQGFKNTIPIYGVNGLLEEHLSLFNRRIKEAYLVFDADEPGKKGAEAVLLRLKEKEIVSYIVELPSKDVNLYFKRHTPEEFEQLLKKANPKALEQSEKVSKREQTLYQEREFGFIVGYGERFYEIKGIQRSETQLKVTIKASRDLHPNAPFELTTLDLYSSRSRAWFAKACVEIFSASEELIKEDIGRLLALVESWRPKEKKVSAKEPTKEEREQALRFLKNPEMFKEILSDLDTMGITGEETNKLALYLASVSRKLDEPLSALIQSRSAAGKSTLQDAILSLVPEEDYVKYTRITDQALFYKSEDSLIHKIIAIEEDEGMTGAAYSIRNIQSSKKITVAATGKDPTTGKMKTEEYTVKGPVAVMITTTAVELEGEMSSRFLFLSIDESSKMTEAIHKKQREADTLEGLLRKKKKELIITKHQTAQRLLKPLSVVNPYSPCLSYPTGSLRTRRDHKKYLGLIRAIAYLFQHQKEIKTVEIAQEVAQEVGSQKVDYIEVSLEDIDKANRLAHEILGQSLDELAPPSRSLLTSIHQMVKDQTGAKNLPTDQFLFNRRMIREYTGWTDWQIRAHMKQLEELEYVHVRVGAQGKQYSYALHYKGQPEQQGRCYLNLTPVEEIRKMLPKEKAV